jgi:hypothetical protein
MSTIEPWETITISPLNGRLGIACDIGGQGVGFTLSMIEPWVARAIDIFGSVGGGVGVIVDRDQTGKVVGLRHPLTGDVLPFSDVQPVRSGSAPDKADGEALAFINAHRRRIAQRPLDPEVAGWTTDDVLLEAGRLGWPGIDTAKPR